VERLQDPGLAGPYHFRLGHTASQVGDHARAAQHAQHALEAATRCGDTTTMSRAYFLLSIEGLWPPSHYASGADRGPGVARPLLLCRRVQLHRPRGIDACLGGLQPGVCHR
jgi:hypothetical protein